jgi:hypothetical protein
MLNEDCLLLDTLNLALVGVGCPSMVVEFRMRMTGRACRGMSCLWHTERERAMRNESTKIYVIEATKVILRSHSTSSHQSAKNLIRMQN